MAALGGGLMAGLFFTFSNFMMKALGTLPPEKGMAAMRSINLAILNPLFLVVFLGTAIVCLPLAIYALLHWAEPGSRWMLAGALLDLVGSLAVTVVCNIPRNDALAAVDPTSAEGTRLWRDFLGSWTAWNHVRTIMTIAATASFVIAFRQLRQPLS